MDVCAYLHRLGISGPVSVSEESLITLTRAHLEKVPFENLEVRYEHREPSLEPDALFHKVVENKRGGYCFELNKLFYLLLKELGFQCYCVPARVVHMRPEERPFSHRATVVVVNGRKWLCDVGFGGAGPKGALRIDTEEKQTVYGDTFRVYPDNEVYKGEVVISRFDGGEEQRVLVFFDRPWTEADFVTLNSYYATYHRSPFKMKRILYLCNTDGWVSLTENTLTILRGNQRQIVELQSEDEVKEVIEQRFGLFVTPL